MKFRDRVPGTWMWEVAHELSTPRITLAEPALEPQPGDIVVKPIAGRSHARRFRVETWETHDLLDGPFRTKDEAMEAALELAVTAHVVVWLDDSDTACSHQLDPVPLYRGDSTGAPARSVA